LSQRQEGWRVLSSHYDDGGYSGGNIERPALKRLLEDVEAGKVDVIVVYKVDRLTRSLTDFAKIVQALDARRVSFVSITQQFNTTSSMGRLTLNVLLSFAQFEREVTGERIRDKIAASKKRGIWMGGAVPLGYDLEDRKLIPNPKEAAIVCQIFALYVTLGCVSKLETQLKRENIQSKVWTTKAGARRGGAFFARGALYDLLRNRLYLGEIRHHDQWYPGEHQGILPMELWETVQARLSSNLTARRHRVSERSSSLLTGLMEDANGSRFTPSFTIKNGRKYRYYISRLAIKKTAIENTGAMRLPAHEVEKRVTEKLHDFLKSDAELFDGLSAPGESPAIIRPLVAAAKKLATKLLLLRPDELRDVLASFLSRVVIRENDIQVLISRTGLLQRLGNGENFAADSLGGPRTSAGVVDLICLTIEAKLKQYGGELHMVVPPNSIAGEPSRQARTSLIKAVARAHGWYERVLEGKALDQRSLARHAGLTERYVRKVFACAFLAPDIVEAILQGRQPLDLNFDKLCKHIPLSWVEQRRQFGFPPTLSQ
jgi:site-specific DNA recombinase